MVLYTYCLVASTNNLENCTLAQISQTILSVTELSNDVSTSFAMVQASNIAPIFTMADFAKMWSKNHKTISTRIETLNRLTVVCILVQIKLFSNSGTGKCHFFGSWFFGFLSKKDVLELCKYLPQLLYLTQKLGTYKVLAGKDSR